MLSAHSFNKKINHNLFLIKNLFKNKKIYVLDCNKQFSYIL